MGSHGTPRVQREVSMRGLFVVLAVFIASTAIAQEDPLARARSMATSGQREQALRLLETQMLQHPRDEDARTLYGIILSWDGQFDRAMKELRAVLAKNPGNEDARQALERIERWSQGPSVHRTQLSLGINYDDYERSEAWRETFIELKVATRRAALLGRVSHAHRFGQDDEQFEVEAYPRLTRRSYAFLSIGYAPDATLYPESRFGAELYQGFGKGFEASIGARRLDFEATGATNVYTVSLSKYLGNWLIGARAYQSDTDTAVQFMARRYYGDRGGYLGLRFGQGSTRDDVRSAADLQSLEIREVAAEGLFTLTDRWVINVRGGVGRDSQQNRYSVSSALGLRF
jgi:YaiO family outer membrane protein